MIHYLVFLCSGGSREAPPPLFLGQIEAQRAKKNFFETASPPPPYLRVCMTAPLLI